MFSVRSLVIFDEVNIRNSEQIKRVVMVNLDTRLRGNIKSRSHCLMGSIPSLYSGGLWFKSQPRLTILYEVFRGHPQFLIANAGRPPQIRPNPFPST